MVRDGTGKFVKGNGGGPGRPKKAREERYREILLNTVTFDDWQDIIKRAVNDAKKGETSARKWLSDYLIGPPVERKEITGADGGPLMIALNWGDNGTDNTNDA